MGSFYEAVAGMDPLTPWVLPEEHAIAAATSAPGWRKPPHRLDGQPSRIA